MERVLAVAVNDGGGALVMIITADYPDICIINVGRLRGWIQEHSRSHGRMKDTDLGGRKQTGGRAETAQEYSKPTIYVKGSSRCCAYRFWTSKPQDQCRFALVVCCGRQGYE